MTSQDGLALLKQMHQRGEITDEQYDTLRRHVLWGTPLPQTPDGLPAPRSTPDPTAHPTTQPTGRPPARRIADRAAGPGAGYVPGAATVGPGRSPDPPHRYPADESGQYGRYPRDPLGQYAPDRYPPDPPARYSPDPRGQYPADPSGRPDPRNLYADPRSVYPDPRGLPAESVGWHPADRVEPPAAPPRRYGSRRERREAEEARDQAAYLPAAASTGPLPPVPEAPPRRRHRRDDTEIPPADDPPPARRHRHAPLDGPAPARGRRAAEPDQRQRPAPPDEATPRRAAGGRRAAPEEALAEAPDQRSGKQRRRPRRRSVVAVLTSVVLALALAAGGVYWFELRRQGLAPPAYARQACGAVRDWQQTVDSTNARLVNQISRQQNKATVRSDVTAYYTTVAGSTDKLRVAILDLGAADLAGGRAYSDSLAAAVGDQASALRRLAGQAARLDPAAATFQADLQGVLTGADAAVSAVTAALARPAAGITTELRTTLSNEPACAPYVG
jgi:hypothetical protein